jgi:hypothetical protein
VFQSAGRYHCVYLPANTTEGVETMVFIYESADVSVIGAATLKTATDGITVCFGGWV